MTPTKVTCFQMYCTSPYKIKTLYSVVNCFHLRSSHIHHVDNTNGRKLKKYECLWNPVNWFKYYLWWTTHTCTWWYH